MANYVFSSHFFNSVALELLEDDVRPDVVVVCCGGGGLVSGVAAGIRQSGLTDCRIYAVEPKGCKSTVNERDRDTKSKLIKDAQITFFSILKI